MARRGSGGGGYGLFLAIFIIGIIITLISNIFNFPIAITHGPQQYLSNIWQGHSDFYGKSKSNFKVYDKILTISELKKETPKAIIKRGYPFKFMGYIQKGSLTWIAVKVFKGSSVINGYFLITEKSGDSTFWTAVPFKNGDKINNKYFRKVFDKELQTARDYYKNLFIKEVYGRVNVKEISGNLNVQNIRESEKYKIIPYISTDKKACYCTNKEYEIVEELDKRLMGDNFDTNFLQTDDNHDILYSEIPKESTLVKIASKWYFKIGFPIFLWIFLKSLGGFAFTVSPKCPECGSKDFSLAERQLIGEEYKHEKKNGERDRRYKNNPLISTYNLYFECNECPHSWECEETESSSGDKTGNIKKRRKRAPRRAQKSEQNSQTAQKSNPSPPAIPKPDSDRLSRKIKQVDRLPESRNNQKAAKVYPTKQNSKALLIQGDMTVDELRSSFKNASDINIRIYNGKRFADGDSALYSLGYKFPRPLKLRLNERMSVASLEKAFKEKIGIAIQIEDRNGKLAKNSLSIFQI